MSTVFFFEMFFKTRIHPALCSNPLYDNYIMLDCEYIFTDFFIENVKRMSEDNKKKMKFIDIINILRKEFQINGNICEVINISCSRLNINPENECLTNLAKKCIVNL